MPYQRDASRDGIGILTDNERGKTASAIMMVKVAVIYQMWYSRKLANLSFDCVIFIKCKGK